MTTRALILGLFLLLGLARIPAQSDQPAPTPTPTPAPAVALTLTPSKTAVEVGEPLSLRAEVKAGGEFEILELEFPKDQQPLVYLGRARPAGGGVFEVPIRFLRKPDGPMGPARAKVYAQGSSTPLEAESSQFTVEVTPPEGEAKFEVAGYTEPLDLPFNYFWRNLIIAAAIVLGAGLLALLGWLMVRLLRRTVFAPVVVPPVPPIEQALASVRDLKTLETFNRLGSDRHYTGLSNTIRAYLEHQFHLPALEMTEDEVTDLLKHQLATLPGTAGLPAVLTRSSLAKFARQRLTADVALEDCKTAEGFLLMEKGRLEAERREAEARKSAAPPKPAEEGAA